MNNEKKQKTLHSTYQIIKDPCNGKQCQHNISSYGETKDHKKTSYIRIHEEKYIQIYIDYLIE